MTPVARAVLTLAVSAGLALAGCSRDETVESDAERFCGEAAANADLITNPPLGSEAELAAALDFYRLMGQLAPIGIATEWAALVGVMETANTMVPGNPVSEQKVAMAAYAVEPSAYAVKVWLQQYCGVDVPITTIVPHDLGPAKTAPPPTTPDE